MSPAKGRQQAAWNRRRQEVVLLAGRLQRGLQQALARATPAALGCLVVGLAGLGTVRRAQCQAGCHSKRSLVGWILPQPALAAEWLQAATEPAAGAQR